MFFTFTTKQLALSPFTGRTEANQELNFIWVSIRLLKFIPGFVTISDLGIPDALFALSCWLAGSCQSKNISFLMQSKRQCLLRGIQMCLKIGSTFSFLRGVESKRSGKVSSTFNGGLFCYATLFHLNKFLSLKIGSHLAISQLKMHL